MADNDPPKAYPILYIIIIIILLPLLTFTGNPSHNAVERKEKREIAKKQSPSEAVTKKKRKKKKKEEKISETKSNKKKTVKPKKSRAKPKAKTLSDKEYFEKVLATYQVEVYDKLERPANRTDLVIRYYKKENDQGIINSLKPLGLYIHERPSNEAYDDSSSNSLFYGDSVSKADIEIIAYKLISAGLDLKAIVPSRYHDTWKVNTLEIGSDTLYNDSPSLTLSDIRNKWGSK